MNLVAQEYGPQKASDSQAGSSRVILKGSDLFARAVRIGFAVGIKKPRAIARGCVVA